MAGNEISIHLSTYLKDAGIKATKQQVDRLSRDIQKMNREAQISTEATASKLFKLPGVFGKIQAAASGAFGVLLAGAAALKVGIDIGNWVYQKVVMPLFGIKDPIKELKKENAELKRQAEEAASKWEAALQRWSNAWAKEIAGADKARQAIEDVTQAYLKMHAAKERVASAGNDAKLLGMERDRFNAMAGASTPEEATALGKYHDVLIAEEKAKQSLAKFDKDAEAAEVRQAAAEKDLHEAVRKRVALKRQAFELDAKIARMQSEESTRRFGFNKAAEEEEKLLQQKAALEERIAAADRDVEKRKANVAAMAEARTAEAQERKNVEERANLEIDEKKKAYDDYVAYVEQEDARRAEEEWQRQQDIVRRAAEEELRERQRVERELAAQRINDLRAELSERQRAESEAKSRQSAAAGGLSQAWGWYRNQSQMQAVIDEQKAQAMAEAQWEKDFERLKFRRRDWRTAEFGSLSASDEAVRQVAFAKEEKAAADRAVIETAENTRNLAEKLDELLQIKG